ncbi:hypothetical protein CLTEP_16110 [Clostridium tepidiprofundi DSM 19306]|uniref:Uncharacterized protein n=1 Tax=Clostridium tepidiprofundi DSM 19306 TaxID=1121338 RepID=A0A151B3E8_9CLOT|nr:hypothetical protein [Clostridium tepidiprofundi]KYH34459.1 hypothetical protein CLTEP_16110 [Clostridium tepidiprofundi DSM 19306]
MKNKRKGIVIISLISIIAIIGIIFAMKNNTNNSKNAIIEAYVRKAPVGCAVTVNLTEKGKKDYPKAYKYQVYYKGQLASAVEKLGRPTTVFPARKSGDEVEIHLLDSKKKEIATVKTKLIKERYRD